MQEHASLIFDRQLQVGRISGMMRMRLVRPCVQASAPRSFFLSSHLLEHALARGALDESHLQGNIAQV